MHREPGIDRFWNDDLTFKCSLNDFSPIIAKRLLFWLSSFCKLLRYLAKMLSLPVLGPVGGLSLAT
jgi:hypothetical protein